MKYLFLLLLIPSIVFADVDTMDGTAITNESDIDGFSSNISEIDGQTVVSGSIDYTDCSELGTFEMYWNGQHTTSDVTACKSGGTITATNNATIEVPTTPSNISGGKAVKIDANDEDITFPVTAGDIFNSSNGTYVCNLYLSASTGTNSIFRVGSGENVMSAVVSTNNTIALAFFHQGTFVTMTTTNTVPDTTWTVIMVAWVNGGNISVKIGANSWEDDADGDNWGPLASEPATVPIGNSTQTDEIFIDDIYLSTTSLR